MLARTLFLLAAGAALSGCVARAAYDVATIPVRTGAKVVDWTTTSRDEADRNLGRKVRREREQQAREQKRDEKRAREAARRAPPAN